MRNHLISLSLSFIIDSTSAPDPVRIALETESAMWFRDLLISGGVVAFGCLLELWETAVSLRNWFRARRGLEVNENPRSWGIPIAALGLLLVIGGVVAEVAYEGLSSSADARLRSHESDVLSAAETIAATADKKAADAEERAGKLEKEAARLNKEAEDEHMARVRLEAEIQPRRLSSEQVKGITDSLKPYAGKTVMVATYSQDVEAMVLAIQIEEALGKAKIKVFDLLGTFNAMGRPLYMGVMIDTNSTDPKLDSALLDALVLKGRLVALPGPVMFGEGSTMYRPSASAMGVAPGTVIRDDAFIFVGEKPIDQHLPAPLVNSKSKPITKP